MEVSTASFSSVANPAGDQPARRSNSHKREIGNEAVWSLSTAKPGNGVDQLRDDSVSRLHTRARLWYGCVRCVCRDVVNSGAGPLGSTKNPLAEPQPRSPAQVDTYWQSDGTQPHLCNIQFQKKMSIHEVAFYLDHKVPTDEASRGHSPRRSPRSHSSGRCVRQAPLLL